MRLHYQFVMANERRTVYDYFMLMCGPAPFRRTIVEPKGVDGLYRQDGSYVDGPNVDGSYVDRSNVDGLSPGDSRTAVLSAAIPGAACSAPASAAGNGEAAASGQP
jgi:hypothetical protein